MLDGQGAVCNILRWMASTALADPPSGSRTTLVKIDDQVGAGTTNSIEWACCKSCGISEQYAVMRHIVADFTYAVSPGPGVNVLPALVERHTDHTTLSRYDGSRFQRFQKGS